MNSLHILARICWAQFWIFQSKWAVGKNSRKNPRRSSSVNFGVLKKQLLVLQINQIWYLHTQHPCPNRFQKLLDRFKKFRKLTYVRIHHIVVNFATKNSLPVHRAQSKRFQCSNTLRCPVSFLALWRPAESFLRTWDDRLIPSDWSRQWQIRQIYISKWLGNCFLVETTTLRHPMGSFFTIGCLH